MKQSNLNRKKSKVGQSPGSIVFIGNHTNEELIIREITYNSEQIHDKIIKAEELSSKSELNFKKWYAVYGLDKEEEIALFDKILNIHPVILEDVVNTEYRPKISIFEDTIFLILKKIEYDEETLITKSEHISLILNKEFLVSFQEFKNDNFYQIHQRLSIPNSKIRSRGLDYLFYQLIKLIIEDLHQIIYLISYKLDQLEQEILSDSTNIELQKLMQIKRNINTLSQAVRPIKEIVRKLVVEDSKILSLENEIYLKDVKEQINQTIILLDELKDSFAIIFDIYSSGLNLKMNEIMKFLTAISTIFIPLTFIAGIYGMNFQFMPELNFYFAYPILITLMILLGFAMFLYFKRKKWIN